jgi:hypothetical protein
MAVFGRGWTTALAIVLLLVSAETMGFAQTSSSASLPNAPTGSLSGKLTDLHSKPLGGISIIARNQATGVETRLMTTASGSYRFRALAPGEYTLEAESPQLGRGQVQDVVVNAGHEARVQAAMNFSPLTDRLALAALQDTIRREVNRDDFQPETSPINDAALPSGALWMLPLRERRLAAAVEIPAPIFFASPTTLPSEPFRLLPLTESNGPHVPVPEETSVGWNGHVLHRVREARESVSTNYLAPAEQTKPTEASTSKPDGTAAPAEAHSTQPLPMPILAASRESNQVSPAVTITLSAQELQSLPVNGRHWQDFVLDSAPTSATPAAGQGRISLQGSNQQQTEVAVDGTSLQLAFGSTNDTNESGQSSSGLGPLGQSADKPAAMGQIGVGGHGFSLNESAIRRVQTTVGNVAAAEVRAAGGSLNVETQSGSNELHGRAFLFDRQNVWGAQNPFTRWVQNTGTVTSPVFTSIPYTPPDRATVWGVGVGGRIRRNKIYWFAALDNYNRNDPGVSMVKNPSVFFASQKEATMQVLGARLGMTEEQAVTTYNNMLETLDGLLGPAARTATQWSGFGRVDWQASERHHFTLEGIGARWNAPNGGLTRVSTTYGTHSYGSTKASEKWLAGRWQAFLTPNLMSVTKISVGHTMREARPSTPSAFEQEFLSGNRWGQLPEMIVDSSYGFIIGNPSRYGKGSYPNEHVYQGQESLDWVHGKLLVKTGFSVSHNSDATSLLRNQTGTYSYDNVVNFTTDVWDFENGWGELNPNLTQHNCDATGNGVGNLPCYSYYSQTMGPSEWHLSSNDWAGYVNAQWQANDHLVFSAGVRWEREQLPPPLSALRNAELPLTEKLPSLGNNWGPRIGLALGTGEGYWPVLRLGYGMYFGRTPNAAVETALTQTGSFNGDLSFFMRPTDDCQYCAGGAPPFPYVLVGTPGSAIRPGAVEFAPHFHNPEIHQAMVTVEETLPGHVELTASAMVSLGRRLPISIDTNLDTANSSTITYNVVDGTGKGPIKTSQLTVPFYASWPSTASSTGFIGRPNTNYQQITQIMSRANSTYEAAMLNVTHYGRRGLSLHAHYVYSHAMDWNPNESSQVAGNDILDPTNFKQEYGVSNLDIRHSATAMVSYKAPWKLRGLAGKLGNDWMLSSVGRFRSGLPYTMRTSGSLAKEFNTSGTAIVGLGPGMNGSGGDNRVYGVGRNTYRYPATWTIDLRLGRRFNLGHMRRLELLAESFNLFNHQNVTELETTGYTIGSGGKTGALPTLNFLTGLTSSTTAFGKPRNVNATNFYRERQIQLGIRMSF